MLKRKDIDTSEAIVIHDKAETATNYERPGFLQMLESIRQGLVSVVAVDDQSRISPPR